MRVNAKPPLVIFSQELFPRMSSVYRKGKSYQGPEVSYVDAKRHDFASGFVISACRPKTPKHA